MLAASDEVKNKRPLPGTGADSSLVDRLREDPNLDMDVMQFLVVSGFTYEFGSLKENHDEIVRQEIYERYVMRRSLLSVKTKKLETRIYNALSLAYRDDHQPITTLRDLKLYVEERRAGKVDVPHLDLVSIAYLNKALRNYGIDEIRIFATSALAEARINKLGSYRPPPTFI